MIVLGPNAGNWTLVLRPIGLWDTLMRCRGVSTYPVEEQHGELQVEIQRTPKAPVRARLRTEAGLLGEMRGSDAAGDATLRRSRVRPMQCGG